MITESCERKLALYYIFNCGNMTSGVMWCDIDLYNWFNKFYGFYMEVVVGIISGCGLSIHMHRGN